jgi:SAM-dependent methyltransferase
MTIFYRKYSNYIDYLNHQASKMDKLLKKKYKFAQRAQRVRPEYFDQRVKKFLSHFKMYSSDMKPGKILCLGARNGAEVKAFRKMGFKNSIGIDLNPGKNNEYVIKGDFHNMEFKDNTFENVFTNSLDHIFDIRKLSKEINRILVPSGILILEISHFLDFKEKNRQEDLNNKKKYESFCCDNFDDIKEGFEEMEIVRKGEFKEKKLFVILKNKSI